MKKGETGYTVSGGLGTSCSAACSCGVVPVSFSGSDRALPSDSETVTFALRAWDGLFFLYLLVKEQCKGA